MGEQQQHHHDGDAHDLRYQREANLQPPSRRVPMLEARRPENLIGSERGKAIHLVAEHLTRIVLGFGGVRGRYGTTKRASN